MKLTKETLKRIIKEELNRVIGEQDGVDFQGMLASEISDEDLYQRVILAKDSGMLEQPEEMVEKFLEDYRIAIDKLNSVGGLKNKDNWTNAESTMVYNLEMDFYRTESTKMLRKAGLLEQ